MWRTAEPRFGWVRCAPVGAREQDVEVDGLMPRVRDAGDLDEVLIQPVRFGIFAHLDEDFGAAIAAEG
jgi:hypothetical protein